MATREWGIITTGQKKTKSKLKTKAKKRTTSAKVKPYPKQPKMSDSIAVWERYDDKCAKIAAENKKAKDEFQKTLDEKTKIKQFKEEIKDAVKEAKNYKPKSKLRKR